jgi:LEA14-like dessication related protein
MKTHYHPPLALFLALALLSFLSGCSSFPWKEKTAMPTVSLANMELQGIKGLETIFRLQLRVINPDEEPIEVRGFTCALKVNGKSFATGISDEHVTVPASGTTTLPVLVYAGVFDLVGPVIELLQNQSSQPVKPLTYELTGRLRLGENGETKMPFSLKGSLPPEQ